LLPSGLSTDTTASASNDDRAWRFKTIEIHLQVCLVASGQGAGSSFTVALYSVALSRTHA
jgi:hypothetical protein